MKVSVCLITYGQEALIAQAIDSVLMQATDFPFEIVIGEDAGPDGTRAICEDYARKHPDKIRLLPPTKNMGTTRNFARVMEACTGTYIAVLEGDDYWTSPQKLQKQADFLDAHPDHVTCFHATQLVDRHGTPKVVIPVERMRKPTSTLQDLIENFSFMCTCSIMFRNRAFPYFPEVFFCSEKMIDWPLNVLNAERGAIGFLEEVMAVYRSNSGDTAFTAKPLAVIKQEEIKVNEAINRYFNFKYDAIIQRRIARDHYAIAMDYLARGEFILAGRALRESARRKLGAFAVLRGIVFDGPLHWARGLARRRMPNVYAGLKGAVRGR